MKSAASEKQFACERCFEDPYLVERFSESQTKSNCDWCGARSVRVLPLEKFGGDFREVVSQLYQPDDRGEFLEELLLTDWPRILGRRFQKRSRNQCRSLLIAILEAGMTGKDLHTQGFDYSGLFCRKSGQLEDQWQTRIERIIRSEGINSAESEEEAKVGDEVASSLEVALEDLSCEMAANMLLFRARIHAPSTRKELFEPFDLQAPPPEKAGPGRANRKGQPVLYLASDANTAIAEVRAFKNAAVAVATVRLTRLARVIDTVETAGVSSPFGEELLKWRLDMAALFRRFGWELSRPVLPGESNQKPGYEPTQHLAEFVKQCGYSGIKYPSAMGSGFNVVVFDRSLAEIESVSYFRVRATMVSKRCFGPYETPYEDGPYDYLFDAKP